jgi:hypothetical protein
MNLLDNILLSTRVYLEWMDRVGSAADALRSCGLSPEDIPDETAEVMPDGSLRIFVPLPGRPPLELLVPSGEWAWKQ